MILAVLGVLAVVLGVLASLGVCMLGAGVSFWVHQKWGIVASMVMWFAFLVSFLFGLDWLLFDSNLEGLAWPK